MTKGIVSDTLANNNDIIFNSDQSAIMNLDASIGIYAYLKLSDINLTYMTSFKYVGHLLINASNDTDDINPKVFELYKINIVINSILLLFDLLCSDV